MTTPDQPPSPQDSSPESKGFFGALFDFDFKTFISLRFIKVIYIVFIVIIGGTALVFLVLGIADGNPAAALLGIVVAFFYLILIRVSLELIVLLFRIGENTSAIRDGLGKTN